MSRGGISGFRHERLVQVLDARRLSQSQLADMAGVSPSTVSKWKKGIQAPEPETLVRLAQIVNVQPEWFTRVPSAPLSVPLFRSNASAHVAARGMLKARLEWGQDIVMGMAQIVDFPTVNVPSRKALTPEEITNDEIEWAAAECRDLWRLGRGPIQDIALAAESAGIIVLREETGIAQIEGLSAWSSELQRPIIHLSADKGNGFRSRFDIAHEIGHLVLHRFIENTTNKERHDLLEDQAHYFAGAFLLPPDTFIPEIHRPITLDDMLLLKRRWGVSVAAILMRLASLKIIDADEKLSLFKRRSARWGAKSEPGDEDRKIEKPRLLSRTIELLVEENVMPRESIPQHFGLSSHDTEKLCGLPKGYFEGAGRVVHLTKLRQILNDGEGRSQLGNTVVPFSSSKRNFKQGDDDGK